ncbi:hypothetical protein LguiA_025840 [Lonicera macranthoides]
MVLERLAEYTIKLGYRSFVYVLNQTWYYNVVVNWRQLWVTQVPSKVCSSLRATEISIAATLHWAIWGSRNKVIWTVKSEAAGVIYSRAICMLSQWQSAQVGPTGAAPNEGSLSVIKWSKPMQGKLKCNVDATLFSSIDSIGFGGIVLNHLGAMLGAINGTLCAPADPLLAKAPSCREVLCWLKTEAYSDTTMESNSLLLMNALNGNSGTITDDKLTQPDFNEVVKCMVEIISFRGSKRQNKMGLQADMPLIGQRIIFTSGTRLITDAVRDGAFKIQKSRLFKTVLK